MERRNFIALTGLFTLGASSGLAAMPLGHKMKIPSNFTMEQYHHLMTVADETRLNLQIKGKSSFIRMMLEPVKVISNTEIKNGYKVVYLTQNGNTIELYKDKKGAKTKFY